MPNLKPYYDAALAADAEVKRVLAEMDTAFNDGTAEGKEKALSLRPALDEAQTKAKAANELYVSVRDTTLTNNDAAALFTTPPDAGAQPTQPEEAPKTLKLAEFQALTPAERLAFAKSGGTLEDEAKEQ
jgi:hypothetical protein